MNIVIDSNILFSAIIKDSVTRSIIAYYDEQFLIPSFMFKEMVKYKDELYSKSGLNKEEFEKLLLKLLQKIKIISSEELRPYSEEAIEIMKNIDLKDSEFIACALAYPESIIWSEDKRLKEQARIKIRNTKELLNLFSD